MQTTKLPLQRLLQSASPLNLLLYSSFLLRISWSPVKQYWRKNKLKCQIFLPSSFCLHVKFVFPFALVRAIWTEQYLNNKEDVWKIQKTNFNFLQCGFCIWLQETKSLSAAPSCPGSWVRIRHNLYLSNLKWNDGYPFIMRAHWGGLSTPHIYTSCIQALDSHGSGRVL